MDYMLLIYRNEADTPEPGTQAHEQFMAGWLAFNQKLIDGGHWIAGAGLQPSVTATTVKVDATAVPTVVDGPYAETKEQLGGYYVISAADLDVALGLARSLPVPNASIEVRPLTFRPDAG